MSLEDAGVMGQASCAALLRMARIIASNPCEREGVRCWLSASSAKTAARRARQSAAASIGDTE